MKNESISMKQARRLIMASQGLSGPVRTSLEIIEHLGYVQIDTISVVERAHHHVFWTRNSKYRPKDLSELVKKRKVFEYWSHAASYLPMSEYRYTLPMKKAFRQRPSSWFPRDPKMMSAVLKRIREEGPLQSKDFEQARRGTTGWWDWKPAKKALERLFLEGRLEITRREGFQKVYDLPERVIPSSVNTKMPSASEYSRFLIERTLRHHGLITAAESAYLRKADVKASVAKEMKKMVAEGELLPVKIDGVDEDYFARPETLHSRPPVSSRVLLLSPFDNLVIQRKKLKALFDFDYQIECYVPAAKRKYGYFSLPIFKGTQPLGRIDCKADRKEKTLIIQSIHSESGEEIIGQLESPLRAFTQFNGCQSMQLPH